MTIQITTIKTTIFSYIEQIKNHPQAKLIYTGFFILLAALVWNSSSSNNNPKQTMKMGMDMPGMHKLTFGPGDGYHVHK